MTNYSLIKRLVSDEFLVEADSEPTENDRDGAVVIPSDAEIKVAPTIQELLELWRAGEHLAVAARLMFSYAAYEDFVKLLFILGEKDALELGRLLDMLADTEGLAPPKTPPKYLEFLAKVARANKDSEVL